MKALIVIDVQNDFMPGGTLPVPKGDTIVPVINRLQLDFDLVVATQDWHPPNHSSFASNHVAKKTFETITLRDTEQTLWPDHCVQGLAGADFHPELNTVAFEAIFRKGTDPEVDSYSAFYDNHHLKSTGLGGYLREKNVDELYFSGLCADICVYYSIKDALAEGFRCHLIESATCPLDSRAFKKIKVDLLEQGVEILK